MCSKQKEKKTQQALPFWPYETVFWYLIIIFEAFIIIILVQKVFYQGAILVYSTLKSILEISYIRPYQSLIDFDVECKILFAPLISLVAKSF